MATDYEKVYQEQRHALGDATGEILAFFQGLTQPVRVLDVGCGQGRDALPIARLGNSVVGVDLSPSGISQLNEDAQLEGLKIEGIVADILDYKPEGLFDVVLFDRTLHMLPAHERLRVLKTYIKHVSEGGYVLINEPRKNIPAMEEVFSQQKKPWFITKKTRGFLFIQKA